MDLMIREIQLELVKKRLNKPFKTSLQTVMEREAILVTVIDENGLEGYGECVAFSTPWYTEETVASCLFILEKVLMPLLVNKRLSAPEQVSELFSAVKGNRMAKAGLEMAVWDLFAKKKGVPLWQMVGGVNEPVSAGVVVAADEEKIAGQVEAAVEKGYSRIKIKITPASDTEMLKKVISEYPNQLFFADANGAFTEKTFDRLLALDSAGFALIEQPFREREWHLHARAKRQMQTPICLDESIASIEDVQQMIDERAGDIVVLKMGRLGGWSETLKVVKLCRKHGIGMWVGGMIEFGVSKAHNLALASLPDITLPGDFSDSRHFWEEDIIDPEIRVENGKIELSREHGIGYEMVMTKS